MKKFLSCHCLMFIANCSGYEPIFSTKDLRFYIDEIENIDNGKITKQIVRNIRSYKLDNNKNKYSLKISNVIRNTEKGTSPSIKAGGNYLNSRYAKIEAIEHGYDDALMINHKGFISEATGSCIFFLKDGALFTPSLDCDILPSITRYRIISLCKKNRIKVIEGRYKPGDLIRSDAAFLCGSMIEIMPISNIDNMKFDTSNSSMFRNIVKLYKKSLILENI